MIIKSTSILKYLPRINERQLLILDSLRTTGEMIDYSINQILNELILISEGGHKKNLPLIFTNVWSIVDNVSSFIRLYKLIPSESNHEILNLITHVKSARDTHQHMYERVDESLISNSQPFFGTLKWTYHNHTKQKAINCIAVPGIYYAKEHDFIIAQYDIDCKIENIILDTVDRKAVKSINISTLLVDLQTIVNELETKLTNQFIENNLQLLDRTSMCDVIMILENSNGA